MSFQALQATRLSENGKMDKKFENQRIFQLS